MDIKQIVIIGSGPAGLTAAIYASRAGLKPIIIDGKAPGGQLMGTSYVENWPGEESILGPDLMAKMRAHAKHFGTEFLSETVVSVDFKNKPLILTTHKNKIIKAHTVIIATGANPKRLSCPGEDQYWGKGVTSCAVCDGALYRDKKVLIVGGGDTAMEDASFMTNFTKDITVVHILDKLTASDAMQKKVINNKNIKIIYDATVTEIKGDGKKVTAATITYQKTKKTKEMAFDGIFIAIGLNPNTTVFKDHIEIDKNGYIIAHEETLTSVPGVFVAGDVADFRYRQAITSAGQGCKAALDAERYLKELNIS